MSAIMPPINFQQWIDEHRDALKPPVCNKQIYPEGDFIVMVVGGPNVRKDYHYNEGPELFYQLEGEMLLKTMQDGEPVDYSIKAGEMFLLPAKVYHSPNRFENSVGLVVEQKRKSGEKDGLLWFCGECHTKLYDEYFELKNIEKDLPPVFERFFASEENRTCSHCNSVMPVPAK